MSVSGNSPKKKSLFYKFLIIVLVLIGINILAYQWYAQLDLTADKRYSTTKATEKMLKSIPGNVNVTVYLKNNKLPAAFKNLSNQTENLLKTFSNQSNRKVSYRFVDPTDNEDAIKTLSEHRMTGFPVTVNDEGGMQQRIVFPWALVSFVPDDGSDVHTLPVMLQESNSMVLNKQILLRSEVLLEYNLGNAIRQLSKTTPDIVGYLLGNGEAVPPQMLSMANNVGQAGYGMDTINLQSHATIPNQYKALIVLQPKQAFSDIDLFKIDQYVMSGGNVLFAIDATLASIDSISGSTFTATPLQTNINNLLFPYGARVNEDLVLDASKNAGIPVAVGGQAQPTMYSWSYFPILDGNEAMPLSKNLQGVLSRFPSSIDLNKNNDAKVQKIPLLQTSTFSKIAGLPAVVMYNQSLMEEPNWATFNKKNVTVAALLEGTFVSPFVQHQSDALQAFINEHKLIVKNQSAKKGKIIVLSDADILLNEMSENGPSEMGVYRFEKGFRFDNASFLQNAITYLVDDNNILEARTKTYQNRILNPERATAEKTKWQFLAIGLPIVLVGLLGLVYSFIRKRKYASK